MEMNRFGQGTGFEDNGFYVGDQDYTSEEAIKQAGLDWQVERRQVFFAINDDPLTNIADAPGYQAIVKADDDTILNIASNSYHPIQNKDAFKFMDSLVKDGEMQFHSAGSFNEGRRVWMLGKIGESEILPKDVTEDFILLYNSHDGTSSLKAVFTNIRMACSNAIRMMFRQGTNTGVSIRHTSKSQEWQANAKQILEAGQEEAHNFQQFAKYLTQKSITDDTFKQIVMELVPDPPPEMKNNRAEKNREKLLELYHSGRGTDIQGVKGTGWGAFNAISEYANHERSTRGKDPSAKRLQSTLFGAGNNIIEKSIPLLKAA